MVKEISHSISAGSFTTDLSLESVGRNDDENEDESSSS